MDDQLTERLIALERRVSQLEDEVAIRELLARYGFNADACRDEEYLDMYTEGGAIDLVVSDQDVYPGRVTFQGKEELRRFIEDPKGHHKPGFYGRSMHLMGNNVVVHLNGDRAVVNSYGVTLQGGSTAVRIFNAANNEWSLIKVDGQWFIEKRRRREIGSDEYASNLQATPA